MSTLPPNRQHHREDLMRTSQANMAVAQPTKTKSASKATHNAAAKQKSQMHRRSRTGLWIFILFCVALLVSLHAIPSYSTSTVGLVWFLCVFFFFEWFDSWHIACPTFSLRRIAPANIISLQKAATHADCEGKSATKARQHVRHASTSASVANTSAQCGGATTMREGSTRTTSR